MIGLSSDPTNMLNKIDHNNNNQQHISKKKPNKSTHVPTACVNCKKAHLACDLSRPCKRCSTLGRSDTCIDIKHKKRGRPKLTASKKWQSSTTAFTSTVPMNLSNSNFTTVLPMAAPGLATCSFDLTLNNQNNNKNIKINAEEASAGQLPQYGMMTIFLSMDLCCARVSDESVDFLNINPGNIDHCSFYDLIHSDSSETLSRVHRLLLDNSHSNRVSQQQPIAFTTTATSELFLTSPPAQLFQIANGSQTFQETLKFKNSGKTGSCRFYLGGGFGADLFVPSTLNHLYMVCIVSELNGITSTSNIVKDIQRSHLSTAPNTISSAMIDSILFNHEQQQLNSILHTSDLISMYNTTTDNDTIQLVNHLYEAIMIQPPLSPSSLNTIKTGYHSSSDSSIGSNSSSSSSRTNNSFGRFLDHGLLPLDQQQQKKSFSLNPTNTADLNIILDDDTLFMLSSASPKTLLNNECWGYDTFAC